MWIVRLMLISMKPSSFSVPSTFYFVSSLKYCSLPSPSSATAYISKEKKYLFLLLYWNAYYCGHQYFPFSQIQWSVFWPWLVLLLSSIWHIILSTFFSGSWGRILPFLTGSFSVSFAGSFSSARLLSIGMPRVPSLAFFYFFFELSSGRSQPLPLL